MKIIMLYAKFLESIFDLVFKMRHYKYKVVIVNTWKYNNKYITCEKTIEKFNRS